MLIDNMTAFVTEPLFIGVNVLGFLAVLNSARTLYLRTRHRWPHAKFICLLHLGSVTLLLCSLLIAGVTAIQFIGSRITADDGWYWPRLWVAVAIGAVGFVGGLVAAVAMAVERWRYGPP